MSLIELADQSERIGRCRREEDNSVLIVMLPKQWVIFGDVKTATGERGNSVLDDVRENEMEPPAAIRTLPIIALENNDICLLLQCAGNDLSVQIFVDRLT